MMRKQVALPVVALILLSSLSTPPAALASFQVPALTGFEADLNLPPERPLTLVSALTESSEVLPSPSAVPSEDGSVLVSWYGDEGQTCIYQGSPDCKTLFQVFGPNGEPISPITSISEVSPPWYYGAPEARWNPAANEWVVFWTSYADDVAPGDAGIYLRRVSATGQLLGDVVSVGLSAIDGRAGAQGAALEFDNGSSSNNGLIWMRSAQKWLFLIYAYLTDGRPTVAYQVLDQDLSAESLPIVFDDAGWRPYGVIAADNQADDEVMAVYRNRANDSFQASKLVVSADGQVELTSGIALSPGGHLNRNPGLAYSAEIDKYVMTFVKTESRGGSTYEDLWAMHLNFSGGTIATESPVKVFENLLFYAQRSWIAVAGDQLFVTQSYNQSYARGGENFSYSTSLLHTLDAESLQLLDTERLSEPVYTSRQNGGFADFFRASQRPVLTQTGENIAVALMSFTDSGWGDVARVLYTALNTVPSDDDGGSEANSDVSASPEVVSDSEEVEAEPFPVSFTGPIISSTSVRMFDQGNEQGFTLFGKRLARITSVSSGATVLGVLSRSKDHITLDVKSLEKGWHTLVILHESGAVLVFSNAFYVK